MNKLHELKRNSMLVIGTTFEYGAVKLEIIEGDDCTECYLEGFDECMSCVCSVKARPDDTEVIYKQVK